MEEKVTPLLDVPYFVKVYCQDRYSEVIEYLDDSSLKKLFSKEKLRLNTGCKSQKYLGDNISLEVLENTGNYTRCKIRRSVKPLTVMRNPMLLFAAELEYRTYAVTHPISLQEARYILVDNYPETNNISQSNSCLTLIKEKKGCFKLSLNDVRQISRERKGEKCISA